MKISDIKTGGHEVSKKDFRCPVDGCDGHGEFAGNGWIVSCVKCGFFCNYEAWIDSVRFTEESKRLAHDQVEFEREVKEGRISCPMCGRGPKVKR
jgi:hypothetical protein